LTDEDDLNDVRQELKDEIRSLKDEIRRSVAQALENSGAGSVRVDLRKDDIAQTEPSSVVVKDLVRMIRDDVKSSLAQRGEMAVDELVEGMPEASAAGLLKSLSNTDRIKMVKMLYSSHRTFSDFKEGTKLDQGSVNHHIKSLASMGLIAHTDDGAYELTKRGRVLVRTLALMNEALGGEQVD
jgi:DNA-binding transcriptional ArsR family regulator